MFERFKRTPGKSDDPQPQQLISLNLGNPEDRDVSDLPLPPMREEGSLRLNLSPQGQKAFSAEIGRRFKEWVSSAAKPDPVFVLEQQNQNGGRAMTTIRRDDGYIWLIFNSPWMAHDYLVQTHLPARVLGYAPENVPAVAKGLIESGLTGFFVDFCPRCRVGNLYPAKALQVSDEFVKYCAFSRLTKRLIGEIWLQRFNALPVDDFKQRRAILEHVADHVDCGNPYLHWTIALYAGLEGDMVGNERAIARLNQFGPPFAGKLKGTSFNFADPESQLRTLPEATVGLLASYGLLKIPPANGPATPSNV